MKKTRTSLIAVLMIVSLVITGFGSDIVRPELVAIPSGSFMMGNTRNDELALKNEDPVHEVELTYDFHIGKYEITNAQFIAFLREMPVSENGKLNNHKVLNTASENCPFVYKNGIFSLKEGFEKRHPVIEITWWGAMEYCNWLSEKENVPKAYDNDGNLLNGNSRITTDITKVEGFRLPTEAEWEYAARGAENDYQTDTDYLYSGSNDLNEAAWYLDNSIKDLYVVNEGVIGIRKVGLKEPNEIGLYDMTGNVWEWCQDCWNDAYYKISPKTNPVNLKKTNTFRVNRGGGWTNYPLYCRITTRGYGKPFASYMTTGFRIAITK